MIGLPLFVFTNAVTVPATTFSLKDTCQLQDSSASALCEEIYHQMIAIHKLDDASLKASGADPTAIADVLIQHAADRTGFGISSAGTTNHPNLTTGDNWQLALAKIARQMAHQASLSRGDVYENNDQDLRSKISPERTMVAHIIPYNSDGTQGAVQAIPLYENAATDAGTTIKNAEGNVIYSGGANTLISSGGLVVPTFALTNEMAVKNYMSLKVVGRNVQQDLAVAQDQIPNANLSSNDPSDPRVVTYRNEIALKSLIGAEAEIYADVPEQDEPHWSMIRKVIGSQDDNGDDAQINLPEVLAEFWYNHFNVEMDSAADWTPGTNGYDRTIRKNMYGTFAELLFSVETHPAMLSYLTNGGNCFQNGSPSNQNLGREILELHTLGQIPDFPTPEDNQSVYTQADVVFSSTLLAGVNVTRQGYHINGGGYIIDKATGKKTGTIPYTLEIKANPFVGTYLNGRCAPSQIIPTGKEKLFTKVFDQTNAVKSASADPFSNTTEHLREAAVHKLTDFLAQHPQTRNNICSKLISQFIQFSNGESNDTLVDQCANKWWGSDGDLKTIYASILASPQFWSHLNIKSKVKNPLELVISLARLNGFNQGDFNANPAMAHSISDQMLGLVNRMGITYRRYIDPTGYDINGSDWLGSGYLFRSVDASLQLGTAYESYNKSLRNPACSDNAEDAFAAVLKTDNLTAPDISYANWSSENMALFNTVFGGNWRVSNTSATYYEQQDIFRIVNDPTLVDCRGPIDAKTNTCREAVPLRGAIALEAASNVFLRK